MSETGNPCICCDQNHPEDGAIGHVGDHWCFACQKEGCMKPVLMPANFYKDAVAEAFEKASIEDMKAVISKEVEKELAAEGNDSWPVCAFHGPKHAWDFDKHGKASCKCGAKPDGIFKFSLETYGAVYEDLSSQQQKIILDEYLAKANEEAAKEGKTVFTSEQLLEGLGQKVKVDVQMQYEIPEDVGKKVQAKVNYGPPMLSELEEFFWKVSGTYFHKMTPTEKAAAYDYYEKVKSGEYKSPFIKCDYCLGEGSVPPFKEKQKSCPHCNGQGKIPIHVGVDWAKTGADETFMTATTTSAPDTGEKKITLDEMVKEIEKIKNTPVMDEGSQDYAGGVKYKSGNWSVVWAARKNIYEVSFNKNPQICGYVALEGNDEVDSVSVKLSPEGKPIIDVHISGTNYGTQRARRLNELMGFDTDDWKTCKPCSGWGVTEEYQHKSGKLTRKPEWACPLCEGVGQVNADSPYDEDGFCRKCEASGFVIHGAGKESAPSRCTTCQGSGRFLTKSKGFYLGTPLPGTAVYFVSPTDFAAMKLTGKTKIALEPMNAPGQKTTIPFARGTVLGHPDVPDGKVHVFAPLSKVPGVYKNMSVPQTGSTVQKVQEVEKVLLANAPDKTSALWKSNVQAVKANLKKLMDLEKKKHHLLIMDEVADAPNPQKIGDIIKKLPIGKNLGPSMIMAVEGQVKKGQHVVGNKKGAVVAYDPNAHEYKDIVGIALGDQTEGGSISVSLNPKLAFVTPKSAANPTDWIMAYSEGQESPKAQDKEAGLFHDLTVALARINTLNEENSKLREYNKHLVTLLGAIYLKYRGPKGDITEEGEARRKRFENIANQL